MSASISTRPPRLGRLLDRSFVVPLLLIALLSSIAACAKTPDKPAPVVSNEPHAGGTVVFGNAEDLVSVNEVLAGGTVLSADVASRLLFLRLFEEQPDYREHPPTFAPALAESYEWSPDHLTLTLHLRPNVVWSDGVPVTADDVRFSWQAQTNPDVAWEFSYLKESVRDVEVVDAHTVRMHFTHAYFAQLADANEGVILPKHAWEKLPFKQWRASSDWFRQNLVVDGPFTLASWTPQQEIVFARNQVLRTRPPRLDRLVIRIVPDASGLLEQLLAGQIDYVPQIPPPRPNASSPRSARASSPSGIGNTPSSAGTRGCRSSPTPTCAERSPWASTDSASSMRCGQLRSPLVLAGDQRNLGARLDSATPALRPAGVEAAPGEQGLEGQRRGRRARPRRSCAALRAPDQRRELHSRRRCGHDPAAAEEPRGRRPAASDRSQHHEREGRQARLRGHDPGLRNRHFARPRLCLLDRFDHQRQ